MRSLMFGSGTNFASSSRAASASFSFVASAAILSTSSIARWRALSSISQWWQANGAVGAIGCGCASVQPFTVCDDQVPVAGDPAHGIGTDTGRRDIWAWRVLDEMVAVVAQIVVL